MAKSGSGGASAAGVGSQAPESGAGSVGGGSELPAGRVSASSSGGYSPETLAARLARYLGETLGASGVEVSVVAAHVSTVRFRFGVGHPLRVTVCREEQLEITDEE